MSFCLLCKRVKPRWRITLIPDDASHASFPSYVVQREKKIIITEENRTQRTQRTHPEGYEDEEGIPKTPIRRRRIEQEKGET
jgi:hypothetical protein